MTRSAGLGDVLLVKYHVLPVPPLLVELARLLLAMPSNLPHTADQKEMSEREEGVKTLHP